MDSSQSWLQIFKNWPAGYPRTGLVVTTFQESIPFANFMIADGVLLLERDKPDAYGARKAMISLDAIAAVKLLDTFELSRFKAFGFEGPASAAK
ncbi:MAG: hypothetical protein KF774_14790 [Planctomyces sp.]|nr:hypothetical protein [Planctomyces sp.]